MNKYVITDYGVQQGCQSLQTAEIQAVLDLCKKEGGMVVIPKGRFYTAALYMHSNTTVYFERGAELYGSDNCDDYEVFPIPAHVDMRSVMELITQYY
jgi:polygalacturonase